MRRIWRVYVEFIWSFGGIFVTICRWNHKQLPWDPANVNAWKTMGDPCIDATSWRCINVESTLFQRCVSAGFLNRADGRSYYVFVFFLK